MPWMPCLARGLLSLFHLLQLLKDPMLADNNPILGLLVILVLPACHETQVF